MPISGLMGEAIKEFQTQLLSLIYSNNYLDYLSACVKNLKFMNSLEASIRENKTKGQLNNIRNDGNVPGIIYGGKEENQKILISKKLLKNLIEKENFLSNIISLNISGKTQNVLPREVKYHIINDEPMHVDFLRVLPGVKIKIEVPVNFINRKILDLKEVES